MSKRSNVLAIMRLGAALVSSTLRQLYKHKNQAKTRSRKLRYLIRVGFDG
jgi:hypothetical protein